MLTEFYIQQKDRWPQNGRHILAQYDNDSIIVYQAYRPEIGLYALKHQKFGGAFKLTRMSWIKPNFLWMMYRSGWGTKQGQEVILSVRLKRDFFDRVLANAVWSTYTGSGFESKQDWKEAMTRSSVRLQWDPDHHPRGNKLERKAIQLGLSGDFLLEYSDEAIIEITDVSAFVQEQRVLLADDLSKLLTPLETVYIPGLKTAIDNIRISLDGSF